MGKKKAPKKPVKYTGALGELICSLLAEGQSLRRICSIDSMPRVSSVMNWLGKGAAKIKPYESFLEQYAGAREAQAEVLFDEIIDISDDDRNDYGFKNNADGDGEGGKPVIMPDNIQRAKLRVDARKWVLSKLKPKKYGDRVTQEITGSLGLTHEDALSQLDSNNDAAREGNTPPAAG